MKTTNENAKTQVFNLVILDKSGSMESIRQQAIDGYNETLATIRVAQEKHKDTQEHFVSLAAFCGCGVTMIYDSTPILQVEQLKPEQYEPCCSTPLFDAIGTTVRKLKNSVKEIEDAAVVVTVITDGYENASHEWNAPAIKALIEECKKDGWVFSFIGASRDILKVAETIAIQNTLLWEKTVQGTEEMFSASGNASSRFFDKIAAPCCAGASVADRKKMRRCYAEQYFDETEN